MKFLTISSSILGAAILSITMSAAASASNLVINGSFEDPGLTSGSWTTYNVGELPGWAPTPGSRIEIRNNFVGTAHDGDHFAELDSHNYDANTPELGLFQDIITEIGKTYQLTFAYGPREQNNVNGDNLLAVSFGDFSQELDAGNNGDGWKIFSQTMTATSELSKLKFLSLGKRDTLGANIDSVSVTAVDDSQDVPEPFSLLGLAVVGTIGATGKLRKRFTC